MKFTILYFWWTDIQLICAINVLAKPYLDRQYYRFDELSLVSIHVHLCNTQMMSDKVK